MLMRQEEHQMVGKEGFLNVYGLQGRRLKPYENLVIHHFNKVFRSPVTKNVPEYALQNKTNNLIIIL